MVAGSTDRAQPVVANVYATPEVDIRTRAGHAGDQGWNMRLINSSINGSEDLLASSLRLEPHQYHPPHYHPLTGEIYFVYEGSCEMTVGDTTHRVQAGTVIYTPRGAAHSIRTHDEGVRVLIVFPEGDLAKIEKVWL